MQKVNLTLTLTVAPMLTPELKVWKLLKNENKKWSREFKRASATIKMKVAKVRAEPKTFSHSRPQTHLLHYDINATGVTN